MKKKKLSLDEIAGRQLDEKGMARVYGGVSCTCSCMTLALSAVNGSANTGDNPPPTQTTAGCDIVVIHPADMCPSPTFPCPTLSDCTPQTNCQNWCVQPYCHIGPGEL